MVTWTTTNTLRDNQIRSYIIIILGFLNRQFRFVPKKAALLLLLLLLLLLGAESFESWSTNLPTMLSTRAAKPLPTINYCHQSGCQILGIPGPNHYFAWVQTISLRGGSNDCASGGFKLFRLGWVQKIFAPIDFYGARCSDTRIQLGNPTLTCVRTCSWAIAD